MTTYDEPNFIHTRRALETYDAGTPDRDRMLAAALTNEEVFAWEKTEHEAITAVRRAFHEDTKTYNSLSACLVADLGFIRRTATVRGGHTLGCPCCGNLLRGGGA